MSFATISDFINRLYASRKASILFTAATWVVVLISLHFYNLDKIQEFTPQLLKPLQEADCMRGDLVRAAADSTVMTAALAAQYDQLTQYKRHHLRTASLFNQNYSACAFTLAFGTIVVGLCALLIAKRGWDQTHDVIRVTFLMNSLAATLALSIMQIYDNERNMDKNVAAYMSYEKLQIDIHGSFLIDRPYRDTLNLKRQKEWSAFVNDQIRNTQAIFVDMDVSGIPDVPVGVEPPAKPE